MRAAVGDSMQPARYVGSEAQVLGLEAEIILLMAKQIDYKIGFLLMEFSCFIASVESCKADMCAGSSLTSEKIWNGHRYILLYCVFNFGGKIMRKLIKRIVGGKIPKKIIPMVTMADEDSPINRPIAA